VPPQAYWPFHRDACRRNEFADAIEVSEPKFAAWMRGHGKLAVLKDDEVRGVGGGGAQQGRGRAAAPAQRRGAPPDATPPRPPARPPARQVDRLERASKPGGCWGLSRAEVMDSIVGRIDPKPRREPGVGLK
jgi:hypothetical protein